VNQRASFPAVVVLPAPAGPTSNTSAGRPERERPLAVPPMTAAISFRTMANSCWEGVRDWSTRAPIACSSTRLSSSRAT